MDQFDAYFRRADLDQDGRISGAEAVSFFQGSGLPKQVLAQIWMHADQNRIGFLNRQEFNNALKLVTVAQSKRDLTPDIVKAALYGPASSKIPPPQINLPPSPTGQSTSFAPTAKMGAIASASPQTLGPRGLLPPNNTISQPHFPTQGSQSMKPSLITQVTSVSSASSPSQSATVLSNPSISTAWLTGRVGAPTAGQTMQAPNRGVSPVVSSPSPKTQDLEMPSSPSVAIDPNTSVSGNGFASYSAFGGDLFSALVPKQDSSISARSAPGSSASIPTSSIPQPKSTNSSLESLQGAFSKQPPIGQQMQIQPLVHQPQDPQTSFSLSQSVSQATSGVISPAVSPVFENSTSNQSQPSWPKMTPAGIQKYSKVFLEVDTDRDGKITGEQARNLFLSWRLPREVLKQVWDLADQDNDSMLSFREFCIALYLMERYREGRSLPTSLPNSVMLDETLVRLAGLPSSSYDNVALGAAPGFRQVPGASGSPRPQIAPASGIMRPPSTATRTDGMRQFSLDKSSSLQLDNPQANRLSHGGQHYVQSNSLEAIDAEKKAEKVEKVILDSKEKLEFYRSKMQDLVLYKSRCDNRLNEIIERASADKREAEMVGKKYEEKYKQVAELASKLTIEEATFREHQERKMELHQAIVNMEQGGSADGILQVRADRIQSELEELMKALAERCKRHGIEIKSAALIELPIGWQPGIPEGAAVWDEEWDKFEDEGLVFDKDPKADGQNATIASKPASASFLDDMYPLDDNSLSNADSNSEKQSSRGERIVDGGSRDTHSEDDLSRSPRGSPTHPASEFSDVFTKSSEVDNEFHRSFDNQGWGTFDGSDDVDSVWGFNPSSKDTSGDGPFESSGFGLSPIRTGSPDNHKRSVFADSVPGTPFSKSANSPRYSEAGDSFFNNNDYSGFSPPRDTFSRYDSISSSRGGDTFARFDSMNSSRGEALARFDSSSRGFDHSRRFTSFDDADPFGSSGPFQASSEAKTPKKASDSWSSF